MSTLTRLVFVMIAYASLNFMVNTSAAAAHNHQASHQAMQSKKERVSSCEGVNIICAKTVTSVFAPNGDLWRLWALHSSIYFQISTDNGGSFS
ncbi:MAG: exo-alpha-sialidase, partial [Colwellia sp.]